MFDLLIHHANTPDGFCDIAVADGIIVETGPALTRPDGLAGIYRCPGALQ
jgi:hypothetical protein